MTGAVRRQPVPICSFGFNIPCRRFLITANVTRDRRIPVVDEFVLRVLKLCGTMPVRRLGSYLGLSGPETDTVVADLERRGLVVIDGDDASLHPSSHEHFRAGGGEELEILETDAWVDRLWFDLVSRNMMRPDGNRPLSNGIDVGVDRSALDLPAEFARAAFQENFADYLRDVRRMANPDRFTLYSVSDVIPERFGSVMIHGFEGLVFEPHPRLVPHLLDAEAHQSARYRPLNTALMDAYRSLRGAEPTGAGHADFRRLTGETVLGQALASEGDLDIDAWLAADTAKRASGRQPLFGAAYVERNRKLFLDMLEQQALPPLRKRTGTRFDLIWFRSGGTKWGVSPDVQELILGVRNSIRAALPRRVNMTSTLVIPRSNTFLRKRFARVFDAGLISPKGFMSPSVEVVLLKGVAAIVLVAARLSRTVSTSVGYVIADPSGVSRLEDAIGWEKASKRSEQVWMPAAEDAAATVRSRPAMRDA